MAAPNNANTAGLAADRVLNRIERFSLGLGDDAACPSVSQAAHVQGAAPDLRVVEKARFAPRAPRPVPGCAESLYYPLYESVMRGKL